MSKPVHLLLLAGALCASSACRNGGASGVGGAVDDRPLALVGGVIHTEPGAPPITDGTLVIEDGRIARVGPRDRVRVPTSALVIDVTGRTVLAGFWNSHVHLLEPEWAGVDTMPAERVTRHLRETFTRFGFVHVFDVASFPEVTLVLRRRIASGDVLGPDIRTTLAPFVPPNGTPRYVAPLRLPELHGPYEARDSVLVRVQQGAEGIKLFTVPITRSEPFPVMDPAVVRAVTDEAHRAGLLVFAHPTNEAGVRAALEGGVDILTHTAPMSRLPDSLLDAMRRARMAMIPTLMLWELDVGPDTTGMREFVRAGQDQARSYLARGGRILFGTDAGYIAVYDPAREYTLMAEGGLDFPAILASLTTAPAAQFGVADRTGRLAPGFDADVVVIDGDPAEDIRALARVRLTIGRGRILHEAESPSPR